MNSMKKIFTIMMTLLLMATSVPGTLVVCFAEGEVATEEETTERTEVGKPGMVAVEGKDVEDGEYDVKVESDSGMFNIVSTKLTVKSGRMTALITLHGDGYKAIYQGTPEEAVKAGGGKAAGSDEEEKEAGGSKDAGDDDRMGEADVVDDKYTYEISIPSLNTKVNVSALSEKYNKWYGHQLVFDAASLPKGAVKIDLDKNKLDVKDGEYTIEVKMEGGTGRASITSPAKLIVKDGIGTAVIEWSSPNYDYMIVGGKKYLAKQNDEGNSMFEIPILTYGEPMKVTADTTAMSTPHEIEYEFTFDKDSVKGGPGAGMLPLIIAGAGLVLLIAIIAIKKATRK